MLPPNIAHVKQQPSPRPQARACIADQKISVAGTFLIVMYPCIALAFPIKIASYYLAAVTIIWLYLSFREKSMFSFRTSTFFCVLPLANYGILLLGMLTTSNVTMGLKTLETKIPLLILPMIFLSGHDFLKNTKKRVVLVTYSIGVALICSYVAIHVLTSSADGSAGYTFEDLSGAINVHPGYFSLYVGFAILLLISQFQFFPKPKKVLAATAIILLFLFDLLLVARMPMIGLIVALLVYLVTVQNFKILLLIIAVFTIFFVSVGYQNPDWTHRILGPTRMLLSGNFEELRHFAYDRVQELTCTLEILSKGEHLMTGYGTGDDNDALFACYSKSSYDWILSQKYNAHNQYLQSVLQNGIMSGFLCLALIGAPLLAKRVKILTHLDFVLFSCLFGIFSLTESTLEVQKGIVFFSFFYGLFAYYVDQDERASAHRKAEPAHKKKH